MIPKKIPLENELCESVNELKDPGKKIIAYTAIIITSVLWASLTAVVSVMYENMRTDNITNEKKIFKLENEKDSLFTLHWQDRIKIIEMKTTDKNN